MKITVYSHHPGLCKDGGQIFEAHKDNQVRDTIERTLALLTLRQEIRILAAAVSVNGEVHTQNIKISPHATIDGQFAFQCVLDFSSAETYTFNLDAVMHKLESLFNSLSSHEQGTVNKTSVFP